jgi:predicted RNA-binding protein associated with RNAse of E/G family
MNNRLDLFLDTLAAAGGRAMYSSTGSRDLEAFKLDVDRLRAYERQGLVRIISEHREATTGSLHVDRVAVELTEMGVKWRRALKSHQSAK